MKMFKFTLWITFLVIGLSAASQETSKRKMQDDFEQYKKNRELDFQGFKQKREAELKKMQQEYLNDPALQHLPGLRNIKALLDRHLYSANQNCVYAIRTLANAAYGELFDPTGEKLIKGY